MANDAESEEFQRNGLAYPKRISVQPLFRNFSTPQLLAQTGANLRSKSSLSRESFNAIRNEAYQIASARPTRYATRTSYGEHYAWRGSLHSSFSGKLPCDESRRNRPHPDELFMTCRMHQVPGFHNADSTIRRDPYIVDGSTDADEREARLGLRTKYIGHPEPVPVPSPVAVPPAPPPLLRDVCAPREVKEKLWREMFDPRHVEVLRRWEEAASEEEREDLRKALRVLARSQDPNKQTRLELVPSLNRYMRIAGIRERIAILKAIKAIESAAPAAGELPSLAPPPAHEPLQVRAKSVRQRARADGVRAESTGLRVYNEGNADFTLHPDWPPILHHHRTNPFGQYDLHDLHHRIEN